MADRKEIKITVSPTGKVSFKVSGHEGTSCLAATKFLEKALGGQVESQTPTEEMYATETVDEGISVKKEW